ncbi:MAG: hypothetical protein QXE05_00355 [Nitrososphaeria archaeon]
MNPINLDHRLKEFITALQISIVSNIYECEYTLPTLNLVAEGGREILQ